MYCASFISQPGTYDSEFHDLTRMIDQVASSLVGFLGVESWHASDSERKCTNYYWADLEALKAFASHPVHRQAKRHYARWYDGYHVIISEIVRSYGDGSILHITPNDRPSRKV